MPIFRVETVNRNSKGDPVWFPFEVSDIRSLAGFFETLEDVGAIHGVRFQAERDRATGRFKVIEKYPLILGVGAIAMVTCMSSALFSDPHDGDIQRRSEKG